MSKAGWFGLLFLGAGFGLTVFLVTMGLSDDAKKKAQNAEDFLASAKEQLNTEEAAFDALAKEHAAYLDPTGAVPSIRAEYQRFRASLASIEGSPDMFNLRAFVKKDSSNDDQTVLNLSTRLQLRMLEELKEFTTPKERLEHVIGYKTEYPKIVKVAEAIVAALSRQPGR